MGRLPKVYTDNFEEKEENPKKKCIEKLDEKSMPTVDQLGAKVNEIIEKINK